MLPYPPPVSDAMHYQTQTPQNFADPNMPPSPSPIEASMSSFRTLATPPYDVNAKPKREKLTRSREGCLTCRVRRKKCTGMPGAGGACEACQRLAIECLGYSAKRPGWMQNSEQLNECRREIRLWLAERGKGPRAVELLSLAKYYGDEGPSAVPPPSPNANKPKSHQSTERRTRRMANAMSWVEEEDELDPEDDEDGEADHEEMDEDRLETITGPITLPTPALIPTAVAPHTHHHPSHTGHPHAHIAQQQPPQQMVDYSAGKPRGMHTDLSQSYLWNFLDDDSSPTASSSVEEDEQHRSSALSISNVRDAFNDAPVVSLVSMWKSSVRPFQYRFANPKYFQELCQILLSDPDVQAVTRNLAAIHGFNRNFGQLDAPEVKTARVELTKVQMAVKAKLLDDSRSQVPTVGHALAAIFGISYVLFTGGTTDWNSYLEVACNWLDRELPQILQGSAKFSYATAFLAETTIWMDILGSVSLQHAPKLHKYYIRSLGNDENADNPYGLFLSRIMGCENRVMLGIATISALAGWKRQQATLGSLDTHELSDKARSIELAYLTPPKTASSLNLTVLPTSEDSSEGEPAGEPVPLSYEKPIDRPGVTAVFRAAAKVYLHTVVSGAFPNSESVSKAVDEAIEVFKTVENGDADRALVFALVITACVVRDDAQKDYITERFKTLSESGNCGQASRLVEEVWRRRDAAGPQNPIEWTAISTEIGGGGGPIILA